MAATQNSVLSRTRSGRVPTSNSTRSLATSRDAPSRSLGTSQARPTPTSSNLSLFLANLRLLNFDLLPDWPDINILTFTNKDATQGQKKRIQCVEWALYQLFALLDPDEARIKLQPFFPPLDQLQSTNLRAALLRCLEQAKKNGSLGRDAILRKTMLDDCRGERLEEILAVFSSAVLKKAVAEDQPRGREYPAVAQTLALEKRGYSGDRADLKPLILSHKVSLRRKLDQKKASKAQYKDFAELLDWKERHILGRREQVTANDHVPRISEDDKSTVRHAVRNNWTGHEQWMEALLYGDAHSVEDGLLTAPFDRVWRRVRSDRLAELEDKSGGLLEQLDSRVRVQRERLSKWQNLKRDMFGDASELPSRGPEQLRRQKGIDLGFGGHESLQLGRMSPRKLAGVQASKVDGEYGHLLNGLQAELKSIDQVPAASSFGRLRGCAQPMKPPKQSRSTEKVAEEPVSELSELEEELARPPAPASRPLSTSSKQHSAASTDSDGPSTQQLRPSRPRLPQPLSSMPAFRPKLQSSEISPIERSKPQPLAKSHVSSSRRSPVHDVVDKLPSLERSPTRSIPPSPYWSPPRSSPQQRTQSPEELPPFPTQQQADQILASMNAASPSPVKQRRPRHKLSLAERTRLSMVRGLGSDPDDEDELAVGSPTRLSRRSTSSRSPKKNKPPTSTTISNDTATPNLANAEADKATEEDDLVARTRRSMANFEAAQQKARVEKQRAQKRAARQQSGSIARQSYFPSADEDGDAAGGEGNSMVVLEELMAKEQAVDYESVFKSRPKIKTSPPATPVRGRWDAEEEGWL